MDPRHLAEDGSALETVSLDRSQIVNHECDLLRPKLDVADKLISQFAAPILAEEISPECGLNSAIHGAFITSC
jgi:hypothetical protein